MDGNASSGCSNMGNPVMGNPVMAERVRGLDLRCNHGLKVKIDVCKRGLNSGKLFLSCPLWNKTPCGYFRWVDDIVKEHSTTTSTTSMEEGRLDSSMEKMEAKYARAKEKKMKLAAENEQLKQQLMIMKHEREMALAREKVLHRVLYGSWLLICIMLIVVGYQKQM